MKKKVIEFMTDAEDALERGDEYGAFIIYKEAVALFEYSGAQFNFGLMYFYGRGCKQNYEEAFKWFSKATEQGNAKAQFQLGVMYQKGYWVDQSDEEAFKWFSKAAKQGDADAQNELAWMSLNGIVVEKDIKRAVEWYAIAVNQEHALAQNNLAMVYENYHNHNEKKFIDCEIMLKLYFKAAEQKNEYALYNLGRIYEKGICVEQDYEKAFEFYERSKNAGYPPANRRYGVLKKKLGKE